MDAGAADREELERRIERETQWRRVYVAGACDAGKTHLALSVLRKLRVQGAAAYVDCDPGQGSVGPPGTIGVTVWPEGREAAERAAARRLRFIGASTPSRAVARMLAGMHSLARAADELGAGRILFDSSGYISGSGAEEFQQAALEILRPDLLVWISSREGSPEPLAALLARGAGHLEVIRRSPHATTRTAAERREARCSRLARAFREAVLRRFECDRVAVMGLQEAGEARGRLVAFCNRDGFVETLGIAESFDPVSSVLVARTPALDPALVSSVQFGVLRLDERGREL